jgi:hypothetical protein
VRHGQRSRRSTVIGYDASESHVTRHGHMLRCSTVTCHDARSHVTMQHGHMNGKKGLSLYLSHRTKSAAIDKWFYFYFQPNHTFELPIYYFSLAEECSWHSSIPGKISPSFIRQICLQILAHTMYISPCVICVN